MVEGIVFGEQVHFLKGGLNAVFTFLGAPDVQGTLTEVTFKYNDEKARGFEFRVEFDLGTYEIVAEAGLFGLTPESRTESLLDEFSSDEAVRMEIFLKPELLEGHFSSGEEAFRQEVSAALNEMLQPDSILKRADSYTYLTVRQQVSGQSFEAGFANKAFEVTDSHLV